MQAFSLSTQFASLRKHPFLRALRRWRARRNGCFRKLAICSRKRHVETSRREEEMGRVKGLLFLLSPIFHCVKSKMAATRILRTRTRFRPLKIRLHCRLYPSAQIKLASVCGKIISLTNWVGNVSRLMTRNLFAVIYLWNSHVHLSSESLTDLTFWRSNVSSLNGTPIWPERNQRSMIRLFRCISFSRQ